MGLNIDSRRSISHAGKMPSFTKRIVLIYLLALPLVTAAAIHGLTAGVLTILIVNGRQDDGLQIDRVPALRGDGIGLGLKEHLVRLFFSVSDAAASWLLEVWRWLSPRRPVEEEGDPEPSEMVV